MNEYGPGDEATWGDVRNTADPRCNADDTDELRKWAANTYKARALSSLRDVSEAIGTVSNADHMKIVAAICAGNAQQVGRVMIAAVHRVIDDQAHSLPHNTIVRMMRESESEC